MGYIRISKKGAFTPSNCSLRWGYTGDDFANKIYELTGAKVQVAKRSELHTFAVISKRWIVERSFGWLDKCRRLWKSCERKLENTLNMVKLAFVSVLLRRL